MARIFIILFIACVGCVEQSMNYFEAGELAHNNSDFDLLMNQTFSKKLIAFGEPKIKGISEETFRLTVISSVGGSYVIRVTKSDSINVVNFRLEGDKPKDDRIGVKNLSFCYSAYSNQFDSLLSKVSLPLSKDDFLNDNSGNVRGADGVIYLFEYKQNGVYKAVLRWDVGFNRVYSDTKNFIYIRDGMNALIPFCLLPIEDDKIKSKRDILFSIFRQSNM